MFEPFAKLPKADFVDAMPELGRDNDRVYRAMAVHIQTLDSAANRSFDRLYIAYSAFMIGLVISPLQGRRMAHGRI